MLHHGIRRTKIKTMIKLINKWLESVKRKDRLAQIKRIRSSFSIHEKDGKLWIMHHDTAIFRIESFANSSEVVRILEDTKDFAVEHAFGERKDDRSEEKYQTFEEYLNA